MKPALVKSYDIYLDSFRNIFVIWNAYVQLGQNSPGKRARFFLEILCILDLSAESAISCQIATAKDRNETGTIYWPGMRCKILDRMQKI